MSAAPSAPLEAVDSGYNYREGASFSCPNPRYEVRYANQSTQVDTRLEPRQPPLSGHDLARLDDHIALKEFGHNLQKAVDAVFPVHQDSRYTSVDVILLRWAEEDPKLPVGIEIDELADVFATQYGFNVEKWLIPAQDCHGRLQVRISEFLSDYDPSTLKIVYYAGHGKLTNHGRLAWTSSRDSGKDRCPTVNWSEIQSTLEESRSDVLILLDCCAAGICTTDEGIGVTELIAACPHNAIANGVGRFSFTHALILKLRKLIQMPFFTVGYLYNALFTEIQNWRNEDSRHKMVPVHLVLSQDNSRPRSIRISRIVNRSRQLKITSPTTSSSVRPTIQSESNKPFYPGTLGNRQSFESRRSSSDDKSSDYPSSLRSLATSISETTGQSPSMHSLATSVAQSGQWPRLLFSIRIHDDVKLGQLSTEFFVEWLRDAPLAVAMIKVEAGFVSDSTLLMISIPAAVLAHLPLNPAITLLGSLRPDTAPSPNHAGSERQKDEYTQPRRPVPRDPISQSSAIGQPFEPEGLEQTFGSFAPQTPGDLGYPIFNEPREYFPDRMSLELTGNHSDAFRRGYQDSAYATASEPNSHNSNFSSRMDREDSA